MLADLFRAIVDVAQKAAGPKAPIITKMETGKRHEQLFMLPSEELHVANEEFPRRAHVVQNIPSLARAANLADIRENRAVWHCDTGVVLVLDFLDYREQRVTMPLVDHSKFAAIEASGTEIYSQRDLIRFLRVNFRDELAAAAPEFIANLRSLKISRSEGADAKIEHGRESMGRQIDMSVSGVEKLPEDVTLEIPIWRDFDLLVHMPCIFSCDVATGEFEFGPAGHAIERARHTAQEWLGRVLEQAIDADVYFGSP